ncbi:MAG: beta-propeller domain-containing protein [Eubacteriales bacterium]|nr:beta-propeller domain-containing protein [Eubacteriales bacterium]
MNDDFLRNKIKQSAESIETPDSLKPEAVQKRLEESSGKIRRFPTRFFASAAAAIVVLSIGVFGMNRMIQNSIMDGDGMERSEEMSEEACMEESYSLQSISDYKELYKALKTYEKEYDTVYDEGMVEESVAESAAADTGSADMAVSQNAAASKDYSTTNLRTEGIDEGDLVKTDGTYLYILKRNRGISIVDAASMKCIKEILLENKGEPLEEMYVDGTCLQVITSGSRTSLKENSASVYYTESSSITTLYTYDISNPKKPVLKGSITQDGDYESSRKSGEWMYLFTSCYAQIPSRSSGMEEAVPRIGEETVSADDIYLPDTCSSQEYLVISSVNQSTPDTAADKKVILSGCELYYVSQNHIFICNGDWNHSSNYTQIMSFLMKDGTLTARAAGSVKGSLNSSFSLDEYKDHLRVVSTYWDGYSGTNINALFVLNEDLQIVGKIDDLAPGESIYSARLMGNTGYFVTYRQMDPLFSADLSDPKNPIILGELKITGFSEYLHPYGDNLLLGIGWETDPDTQERLGLKLSMFDTSDPTNVTEKNKTVLEDIYPYDCPAMNDYKCVMIDSEKNLFGFAYILEDESKQQSLTAVYSLFRYDETNGFTQVFTCTLDDAEENISYARGLYIGDSFYLSTQESLSKFNMSNNFRLTDSIQW